MSRRVARQIDITYRDTLGSITKLIESQHALKQQIGDVDGDGVHLSEHHHQPFKTDAHATRTP